MSVRGDSSRVIYTPVFPFFNITKNSPHFTTYHSFLSDCSCKLSSSGSSDPYHFGGTRSLLSWETIVHYPRYKLRGQIRFKDTTLSLGSDLLSNYCLHCRFVSFIFFLFLFLNEHEELQREVSEKELLNPQAIRALFSFSNHALGACFNPYKALRSLQT